MRAGLAAIAVTIALTSASMARAATIMVGTLDDTSGMGGCSLRDAISTANGANVAGSGCPGPTADPSNTINFSLSGTIALTSTLPAITGHLSIMARPGSDRIRIDGANRYQVMIVRTGAIVSLRNLFIENGMVVAALRAKGGGIENAGVLTVTDSVLYRNSSGTAGLFGGGAYNGPGATLTVINSGFIENMGGVGGAGGIYNRGTLTITKGGVNKNRGTVGAAAGITNDEGGTMTVSDASFFDNSGHIGAGAISNRGALTIVDSAFVGNSTAVNGGGIFNSGTLTITNSTFSGNSTTVSKDRGGSGGGGAIENQEGGTVTVTNSTFFRNSTSAPGIGVAAGGILNRGNLTLKGTILTASPSAPNCAGGAITDAGYNISDDNSCALSAIGSKNNTNPKLDPAGPARNGGVTDTIALELDSPALDQIPPASCTYPAGSLNPCSDSTSDKLTCDQRGFPRPGDPASANCDIGAFELEKCPGGRASAPTLWPANDKFDYESVSGVYDVKITAVDQDEPVDQGASCPDADVVGDSLAQLRAERDDTGDGRVYQLQFTAIDALTERSCSGEVEVCVPRDAAHPTCGDQGAVYDSTKCRAWTGPAAMHAVR